MNIGAYIPILFIVLAAGYVFIRSPSMFDLWAMILAVSFNIGFWTWVLRGRHERT